MSFYQPAQCPFYPDRGDQTTCDATLWRRPLFGASPSDLQRRSESFLRLTQLTSAHYNPLPQTMLLLKRQRLNGVGSSSVRRLAAARLFAFERTKGQPWPRPLQAKFTRISPNASAIRRW